MAERNLLEQGFAGLTSTPPQTHLFCPRIGEEDDENYEDPETSNVLSPAEKEGRIQDGNKRLQMMCWCALVLGLEQNEAGPVKEMFSSRAAYFLKSCPHCVRNWHKVRKTFIKEVVEKLGDETVASQMEDRLNDFDFTRISEGLQGAKEFIEAHGGVAGQSTFIKEERSELLVALFESLCCMPYLSLPDNRRRFNYVFEKIQERKTLKLDTLLPSMTYFIFDENDKRFQFAHYTLSQQPYINKDDFDWAIHDTLADAILRANDINTPIEYLQRFWRGFLFVLNALDQNLVVESLRGMAVQPSIYDLMLAQMSRVNSVPVLKWLLKTFCALLQKSPKAFWDAYSQHSHVAVAEQVIRSPAFRPLLEQSNEVEMAPEGPSATSWVKAFISSISPNQRVEVTDSLLYHLLDEFSKSPKMSSGGKIACYRAAAESLSSALAGFVSPTYKFHAGTSTIQTNALLNLTLKHKDIICQLAQLPLGDLRHAPLSQAGLSVIGLALTLDARITVEEFTALQKSDDHVQNVVKRDSSGIWEAFLDILQPGAYELAKLMLVAFGSLTTVEIFRPPKKKSLSSVKRNFNHEFQKTTEVIARVVDRLSDFDAAVLEQLCMDPTTIFPIVSTLVHGEESIRQAGSAFIKAITGEYIRKDAISKLLDSHFTTALSSFSKVINQMIPLHAALWSPQYTVLRYSDEILNSLCDLSAGILRSRVLTPAEQEVLGAWWDSQWLFLNNAFLQLDAWTCMIDTETMKNFCRQAMEFADALLAQDGLIASALSARSTDSSTPAMKNILEQPRKHCLGLCRLLRLRDYYLVSVIVNVLGKLLRRLMEHDLELEENILLYVQGTCIKNEFGRYNTNTNLTERQRAEIARALRKEDDQAEDVQILSVKKAEGLKKQTRLDAWSKSVDDIRDDIRTGKPAPRPGKDDVRDLLRASTSEKNRTTLDQMRARQSAKAPTRPPITSVESIREKRLKEAEDKRKRDAEAIAKAKALRAPKQIVSGEGSGLQGVSGVHGKDHAPRKSEIMVDSSSEDEENDESGDDAEFLAQTAAGQKDASKRIQSIKLNPRGPVKKAKIERSAKDMRARLIPPMDILHQAILEWDIFHEGNDPPNGHSCSQVSDAYGDPIDYKSTFLPLLINEAWRSFVTAKDETTSKPFDLKVVNRMNVDKFIEVSAAMPIKESKERFLSEGDIVLFSHAANPLEGRDDLHCLARIFRTQFKNGTLEIQYRLSSRAGSILPTLMPQAELYAVKITSMTTIEREYASLESLQYYDLAPEVLEGKPSPMLRFSPEAVDQVMKNYHLNPGQAKAILNAKENDAFTLVQGPPGTGKTKTIVAMVGALLTGSLSTNNGTAIKRPDGLGSTGGKAPTKKLLVCAPSNAAVDELVLRLKAGVKSSAGSFHKINVLRLGRSDAISAAVRDVTLDELVKARVEGAASENSGPSSRELMHKEAGQIKTELADLRPQLETARVTGERAQINQLQRKFDELKRRQSQIGAKIDADKDSGNTTARENEIRRRTIQQEILNSAQVLCATLSGSGHEMFKNLSVEFETVIIDEAAQCVELSALIPMKYGCSKCILVGDPKQLPPTVLSQSAARYGYDQSLFVRMQRNYPDDVHLLDTQYRMHPEISLFPSEEFYERRLVDGDDMNKLRHQPWHLNPLLGPYRFFDVKGVQAAGRKGRSLVNLEELKVAMQIYEKFRSDYPETDMKGKIGIITPYKAQLYELREQFARRYGDKINEAIEFNTTDAFQGRECEVIIFSCVRASPTGGIGFMTDIRRMNVGLTRAKSSLWILGDSRALVQGVFWKKLIEDAKSRDRYTTGDVLSMLRQSKARQPSTSSRDLVSVAPLRHRNGHTPEGDGMKNGACQPPINQRPIDTPMMDAPTMRTSHDTRKTSDVVMQDAPNSQRLPNRLKTPQLAQTYTVLGRNDRPGFRLNNAVSPDFGGINERGEASSVVRSSERPVIHQAGAKRARDNSDDGNNPAKRVANDKLPAKAAPSGPRSMAPTKAGKAPSVRNSKDPSNNNQPSRPMAVPKKKPNSDPFIKRKPNRPR